MARYSVQKLSTDRWIYGDTLKDALEPLTDEGGQYDVVVRVDGMIVGFSTLDRIRDAVARGITVDGNLLTDEDRGGRPT